MPRHYRRGTPKSGRPKGSKKAREDKKVKEFILSIKSQGCNICGYSKCFEALVFHHRNPNNKLSEISKLKQYRSVEKVKREIDKCLLVCSNCHAEIHMKERLENILTEKEILRSPNITQLTLWSQ
jgi:hypothetical protein